MTRARRIRAAGLTGLVWLLVGSSAAAQGAADNDTPIGRFVADVYGSVVPYPDSAEFATARGLDPLVQPGLALGASAGAHIYLLRLGLFTVGLGATVHGSFADNSPGEEDANPGGPALRQRFTAVAPQLSFNFGGRDGWSYVSGGPGRSTMSLFERDGEEPSQRSTGTFNYGGGARWFTNDHLAFSLDLRFYNASPIPSTSTEPGSPRMTIMVLNVGASFK